MDLGLRDVFDPVIMKLYVKKLEQKFVVDDLCGPFVPFVFEDYFDCKKKILIIGQQTNIWIGLRESIEKRLLYDELSKESEKFRNGTNQEATPFWQFAYLLNKEINGDNKLNFVWTNLVKIGTKYGRPCEKYIFDKVSLTLMSVLYLEIIFIDPDVVIFLTGPDYDKYIKWFRADTGNEIIFHKVLEYEIKEFAEFGLFGRQCYRINHPDYLQEQNKFDQYLSDLLILIG